MSKGVLPPNRDGVGDSGFSTRVRAGKCHTSHGPQLAAQDVRRVEGEQQGARRPDVAQRKVDGRGQAQRLPGGVRDDEGLVGTRLDDEDGASLERERLEREVKGKRVVVLGGPAKGRICWGFVLLLWPSGWR